jgi:DNA-directed RNA polymerase subunit beta
MAQKRTNAVGRVFFDKEETLLKTPDLIAHQKESFRDFIDTGLSEIFSELNPIDDYTGQKLALRFKSYNFQDPKTTKDFAKENNLTFEAPLHVQVELTNKVTGEVKEQEIYLGDYPWMTDQGTFVINGTERVIVSQLIRSEGVYFSAETAPNGKNYYGAKVIPVRGAWIELETDPKSGVIYVKIDRRRKLPVTTLLRALGRMTPADIKKEFADVDNGDVKFIEATL